MEQITHYILVTEDTGSFDKFERNVQNKITQGYQPFGSLVLAIVHPASTKMVQPMVKKTWDNTPAEHGGEGTVRRTRPHVIR
jgi:hypothetical protein